MPCSRLQRDLVSDLHEEKCNACCRREGLKRGSREDREEKKQDEQADH